MVAGNIGKRELTIQSRVVVPKFLNNFIWWPLTTYISHQGHLEGEIYVTINIPSRETNINSDTGNKITSRTIFHQRNTDNLNQDNYYVINRKQINVIHSHFM